MENQSFDAVIAAILTAGQLAGFGKALEADRVVQLYRATLAEINKAGTMHDERPSTSFEGDA